MDNPGISLFQGTELQINNSKNIEEEEDLEDQLRRKEELQNLLQANLDDFKYDDSTINSSTNVSVVSADNLDQLYKEAISPNEQLRVLYEVRCREIQTLKDEYDKFKAEKTREIEKQKHQNLLLEGELRQLRISSKNSENLLVDKTDTINVLNKNLQEKDAQISKLEKLVMEYENDLATYKSELSELHLKLQCQNGPFNLNAKYNSEELRQSLQAKIEKLESAFDQEAKKLEICNSEKQSLVNEVARLALEKGSLEKDNETILMNLDNAQQQCKDLINIVEILKHENDHFKGRINEIQGNKDENDFISVMANPSNQSERLKKMLVDKSVELDSLKIKLGHYEEDLKELSEYRQLKCDIYKKEFQKCNNKAHTKELLLMQNELQNYQRLIEDKNQQILSLNLNNRDLKEKIQEMLLQTRNEIQNISSKYNMPQLESMQKELERAEYTVDILSRKLEESEERRLSLLQKLKNETAQKNMETLVEELEKCRDDLRLTEHELAKERKLTYQISKEMELQKAETMQLKSNLEEVKVQLEKCKVTKAAALQGGKSESTDMEDEYESLKSQLKSVMKHLEKNCHDKSAKKEYSEIVVDLKMQMDNLLEQVEEKTTEKWFIEEHINSWKKLLDQLELKDPEEVLKTQYKEAVINLHTSQEKLKELEAMLQGFKNALTITEGEKYSLSMELKEYSKKLQQSQNLASGLEKELDRLKEILKEKESELSNLKLPEKIGKGHIDAENEIENLQKDIELLNEQLNAKEKELVISLQTIKKYQEEKNETKIWFEKMKQEIERLKNENVRLEGELQETKLRENVERHRNLDKDNEYKTRLEEEVMTHELKLRDELQIEYQKRVSDIEKRYQKTCKETTDICKQQKLSLEEQDKKFRESLKMILTECDTCTTKLENEKIELVGKLQLLRNELESYKVKMVVQEDKHFTLLKKMEKEAQKNNEAWKLWSKKVVCSCLDIEATNKKVRDRVIASMDRYDQEVTAIQKLADAKIERKSSRQAKSIKLGLKYS